MLYHSLLMALVHLLVLVLVLDHALGLIHGVDIVRAAGHAPCLPIGNEVCEVVQSLSTLSVSIVQLSSVHNLISLSCALLISL